MNIKEGLEIPLGPDQGSLAVINETGDTKVTWTRSNEVEIDAARAAFQSAKGKGYVAYSVKENGSKGQVISEFDPQAERIILAPPMQGGGRGGMQGGRGGA